MALLRISMEIADAIYTDLGFTTIRKWLARESQSEKNRNDFLNLSPSSEQSELIQSHRFTEELLGGIRREDILPIRPIFNTQSWMDKLGIAGTELEKNDFKELLLSLIHI